MRDADREGSRGNTHLLVSSLFSFCVRGLEGLLRLLKTTKIIIVREFFSEIVFAQLPTRTAW